MDQHQEPLQEQTFWDLLQEIKDPEIPSVSMVEMGMIGKVELQDGIVTVEVLPTFVGCPAIDIMRNNVKEKLGEVEGVQEVKVNFVFEPPWTTERITEAGREKLKEYGIAPPPKAQIEEGEFGWEVKCPYCDSPYTRMENMFGPAACRSILYCESCKNPFEAIKPIG